MFYTFPIILFIIVILIYNTESTEYYSNKILNNITDVFGNINSTGETFLLNYSKRKTPEQIIHIRKNYSDTYCKASLCELFNGSIIQQMPHIACQNNESFSNACGLKPNVIYMGKYRRDLILNLHNLVRARIAAGQLSGYKTAINMPLLKWDNELAYLAGLHVNLCKFSHDLCHNTERFPYSGQNIGYFWKQNKIKSYMKHIKKFIINWFKEYLDANQSYIDAFQTHPQGKKIGHFTVMVSDRVKRIGCAAIRYREPIQFKLTKFLMTCNYDFTNIWGQPIYQSGPTAAGCKSTVNDKYITLCNWDDDL